jgi:hypothetical protein
METSATAEGVVDAPGRHRFFRKRGGPPSTLLKGTMMSTIGSAVGGAASAWTGLQSSRASAMKDRLFAKVDSNGSGSVDKTELQGMLDHIASKTGQSAGSADDLLGKMDSDGNGSLNQDELDAAMKSLMPAPSSTMEFATRRAGGEGSGPPPGGPPPGAGASGTGTTESTDPLDTNGDGVVSAQEKAAGEINDLLKTLASAIDSNGDQSISDDEFDSFRSTLNAALQSGSASSSSSQASSSDSPGANGRPRDGFGMSALTSLVNKAYADATANYAQAAASVSLAA